MCICGAPRPPPFAISSRTQRAISMFKFKRKDKHQERERESVRGSHKLLSTTSSSSSKLLRTTSTGTTAASSASSKRATATYDEAQQQRIARFNSTSTTMLSDDVEDVFYARGGTEVYIGDGTTSTVPRALDSSRSTNSNMSYDDDSSTYSGYSGYSSDSSTRSTGTYRTTATNGRTTEQLRATGLETLNELEEDVSVDRSTARYVGAGPMPPYTSAMASNTPVMQSAINGGDASALRAELADLKLEMQAIKREMMNEMHLTRYDVLKEVTMLKGTIQQLVSILHTSGGVQYDAQAAAALGVELPPVAPELAPHEKEALSRRTTTVTTKQTKERIASSREDQVPPVLRTTSSRLTQLMPVDDSALSTPLNQDQIVEMFPLVDGSIDVQVQARIRETGSREWVFGRVQDWLDSRFNVGADTVLAMVGDAGTGKTVAAAAVSDKFHEQVVAFHFCKFDKKNKSSPRNLLLSLVNQLTGSLPMFKSQLARLNLKYVLEETDVLVLARKVLVDPLMSLEEPLTAKVIVVDGIDQCRLPSGYNDLLSFLSVIIPECPKWLGFLVTSKPSPEFASTMPVSSVLDFSAKNPNYVNDAVCLINDIATVFHDDDVAQAKALLQSKSGGNYMYLEFTKQALTQPGMEEPEGHGGIPVDVLHDLPQSLFEIFDEIFEDKFGKGRTRLWRKALPVLQLIFTAAAGPYAQITEQHVMDSLSYSKDDVRMLRRAFIDIISIRQGTYCIASSALFDWLTDPQRKGESYHVDPTIHVKVLRRVLGGEKLNLPGTASGTPNTTSASPSPKQRATTSSSSSSTGSSERGSGGQRQPQTGTRVVSTAQVPVTRHEPNLHNPTKPVGILKRGSSRT